MNKNNIYPLTSLRFFAALMIVFFHMDYLNNGTNFTKWLYSSFSIDGGYFITFFFTLSGFILTYNYIDKFKTLNKEKLKNFYIGRFSRIYPLHIFTFLLAIPLCLELFFNAPIKQIFISLVNLFTLQGYFINSYDILFSFNGVSWTLSCELLFYLCCPFILFFLNKLNNKSTFKILIYIFIIWSFNIFLVQLFLHTSIEKWVLAIFPFTRMIDFILGSLFCLIFMSLKDTLSIYNKIIPTSLEIISLVVLPMLLIIFPTLQVTLYYPPYHSLVMCIVILVFAFQRGFLSRILSNKCFVLLGNLSFNIYLFHQIIIRYLLK